MPRWQADLALGIIALIWGSTFVLVKNALDTVGPLTFVGLRFALAAAFLTLFFSRRARDLARADWQVGALLGILLALGYVFQTIGLQTTTSAKAGFITGMSVVIVPIMATLLLRRPPGRWAVAGIAVATIGLALLTLNADLSVQSGDLWVLACAVAFALHIVVIARYSQRHDPVRLTLAQLVIVALFATVAAFVFETPRLNLPVKTWAALAFMGVVATALVFSVQVYVQRFTTPTHTALLFSLEPVFAALFGWWWAGEQLGARALLGCGLILLGMIVAELGDGAEPQPQPVAPLVGEPVLVLSAGLKDDDRR